MMHGCFPLQVHKPQICTVLHHFMHVVDVSLPVDETHAKAKTKKNTLNAFVCCHVISTNLKVLYWSFMHGTNIP